MANPGPKSKYYSLQMANRIPEVEQERKLTEIRRYYAQFKRDTQIEEQKLWDILYENDNALKTSLAIHSLEDILEGRVKLNRRMGSKNEDPLPFSEAYRRFIIYRASMMIKIFGKNRQRIRPHYSELYEQEQRPIENNKHNYTQLLEKYNKNQEEDEESRESLVLSDKERRQSRKMSTASVMMARPHHRRSICADSDQSGSESERAGAEGICRRKSVDLAPVVPNANMSESAPFKLPPIREKIS